MFLDRSIDKRSIPRSAWERGLVILIAAWSLGMAQAADPKGIEFFEKRVRPLLADQCYECHGEKKQKGGLRLDSAAAVLQGGESIEAHDQVCSSKANATNTSVIDAEDVRVTGFKRHAP